MLHRVMVSTFASLLLLAGLGCGKKDPTPAASQNGSGTGSASGTAAASGDTAPAEPSETLPIPVNPGDWVSKKLVPAEATVDGVSFTINIPEGLPPHHSKDPGAWIDNKSDDEVFSLHVFTVVLEGPLVTSLDKAKYQSTLRMGEAKFVRAEEKNGGYVITNQPDTDVVEAVSFTKTGDKWLKCKAVRLGEQQADLAKGLVEAICDSVKLK